MNETKEHLHPAAPEAEGAPAEPKSEPSAEAAPEPAAEPVGEPAAQPSAAATTEENGDTEGTAQAAEPSGNGTEQKQEKEKKEKKRKKPRRKGRFITPLILLCILIAGIVGCMMNIAYCQSHFEVNFYQVESVRVASPIRIVVLSDVHLSEFGQDNDDLVHAAKSLHPDLIISAGDMVSYGKSEYGSMLTLSRRLSEIAPFYGVMGNHEDEKTFLEHDETMREKFAAAGMKLLINTCEKLKIKNTDIELVGVSGGKDEYDQYGGKKTMDGLDENSNALRICCAHVPTLFRERLEDYRFDIGIAGHTHGGIIRLPVLGGLYSAEEGFLPQMDGGWVTLDNGAELFVSRGLGNSGRIPRVNNTPELAVIDITWY